MEVVCRLRFVGCRLVRLVGKVRSSKIMIFIFLGLHIYLLALSIDGNARFTNTLFTDTDNR